MDKSLDVYEESSATFSVLKLHSNFTTANLLYFHREPCQMSIRTYYFRISSIKGRDVELLREISGINNTSLGSYPLSRYTRTKGKGRIRYVYKDSQCCLYRACLSSYCLQTDPTLCHNNGSKTHTPATYQHVSVVATTTITREDNSKDQKNHRYLSYLVSHTRIYFGAPSIQNLFTLPTSVRTCTVMDQSVDNIFEFLILEDGSDKLPRNIGKKFPIVAT
jgi:hypothetical protein